MAAVKGGGGCVERIKRFTRTVYFLVRMVASLLALSAPLLVSFGDVAAHFAVVSGFECVWCRSVRDHLEGFEFRAALIDFPLVSAIRSLSIVCVYLFCDGQRVSHGPYLRITSLCSFLSILFLCIKACLYRGDSETQARTPSSLAMEKLHLKNSWGFPSLFLISLIFALVHVLVAYRTRCRARRKLLFHRPDPESLLSYKHVFSGYQKVPRSPIPSTTKTPRCNSEIKRKVSSTGQDEQEFSMSPILDSDSLFMTCCGLTLHYKTGLPKPSTCCRLPHGFNVMLKLNRPPSILSKPHKSYLSTPLLNDPVNLPTNGDCMLNRSHLDRDLKGNGKFGIVLVHGFGGGVFSWRHIIAALACEVGCVVAAFDRPGWGLTSRPCRKEWEEKELSNPYKLQSQVDLLLSFCLEMGFSSVVLVGHDDGGLLALKAAQRIQASGNPSNIEIRAVVLLSLGLSRDVISPLVRVLLRTSIEKKHLVNPLLRTEITQVVNRRAWYDVRKLTPEVLSFYKAPLWIEGWDDALKEMAGVSSEMVLSSQLAASLFKDVGDLPILIIAGLGDALVSFKHAHAMASKFSNSRLVEVSKCGHLPHEECPEAVLAVLSPFITKLVRGLSS